MTPSMSTKSTASTAASAPAESGALALVLVAWAVPGAGHLWLGRRQKGIVFMVALLVMFGLGLWLQGRIFPLALSEPLVALAAVANFGLGVPWLFARMFELGGGTVTATTYEYGNCFLIVAGLLNFLVMLDAYDIALGRK
jgi:hypothetical protein